MDEEGFVVVGKRGKLRRSMSFDGLSLFSRKIEDLLYSHRSARILNRPCDIVVNMPIMPPREDGAYRDVRPISRWYRFQVPALLPLKSQEVEISPFWKGFIPKASTSAVLGSDLYYVGGLYLSDYYCFPPSVPDVLKLNLTSRTPNLVPADYSMISPRIDPLTLVVDQKLFVMSGYLPSPCCPYIPTAGARDGEMYDPKTNKWEPLPELPFKLGKRFIYATLENPNRILIAQILKNQCPMIYEYAAMFYTYDVEHRVWSGLGKRRIHNNCPIGWEGWGEMALTVANTIYWVTRDAHLLAYNVDKDMWIEGSLRGLGIPFLESDELLFLPGFVHLDGQLFGLLQSNDDEAFQLVIIDTLILGSSLQIFVVAVHRYKTEDPTIVTECFSFDASSGPISATDDST
ncbi:uncharacterized protein LOC133874024 [Alnus glutinosa]|uniref:uncharacterized protein LOC133874024 n=1 Tax=Alnus glutinosa TaxID=3517 RepID=UPI002D77830E|nr:uncharacterized protein LOC133874024 [Alnus glutinosa]